MVSNDWKSYQNVSSYELKVKQLWLKAEFGYLSIKQVYIVYRVTPKQTSHKF